MNSILKVAFAACLAIAAGSVSAKAQTVELNGLGSSGLFLQLGLGANDSTGKIDAPCVWSENTNTAYATDTNSGSTLTDKGSAWVAWTTGGGSCAVPGTTSTVYAYLQTDSVVGNRCLYNSNLSTRKCYITYPSGTPAPAGLILKGGVTNCGTTGECDLPSSISTALNSSTLLVNYAGTDIRPEDAEFAITRALTNCGSLVGSSTQYLGLGYSNGGTIDGATSTGGSSFNVINFTLPSSYFVTPVGATPIVIAVNDSTGTGLSTYSNIASQNLADFLDGTYSYTHQVAASPVASGAAVTVYIREPLSGTYNTLEFNDPNRVGTLGGSDPTFATSQDVGYNQFYNANNQVNCTGITTSSPWPVPSTTTKTPLDNPLDFTTTSGGSRQRAIGTGKELAAVVANTSNSLGYSFWSTLNFAGFSTVTSSARYYQVDGIDPLYPTTSSYHNTGTIPTSSAELAAVSLATTGDGTYPLWSFLRLVNIGTTANAYVTDLATSAQDYVGSTHPDFVPTADLLVVRSHFNPPSQSLTLSNGSGASFFGTNKATACSATETGGDVGGVVIGLKSSSWTQSPLTLADQTYCEDTSTTGQTGHRR